jgi:hypothetical protein
MIIDSIRAMDVNIFTSAELAVMLSNLRDQWGLSKTLTARAFMQELLKTKQLRKTDLAFPNRKEVRYVWGASTVYQLLMTLPGQPYFTHSTALLLHQLTEQLSKIIYVNCEGRPLPKSASGLEQRRIDLAFRSNGRVSQNIAKIQGVTVCQLNGKNTGQHGVIQGVEPSGGSVRVTNIERTLIDCTVRPMYSGGVGEVLKAFRVARERDVISVNKLLATLRKLDYVYPFHQAIGFYMERAGGYSDHSLDLVRRMGMNFDFYLTYGMQETEYLREWRLYVPKGF